MNIDDLLDGELGGDDAVDEEDEEEGDGSKSPGADPADDEEKEALSDDGEI